MTNDETLPASVDYAIGEMRPADYCADDAVMIVCAYIAKNPLPAADVPAFMKSVYAARLELGKPVEPAVPVEAQKPAVPIKQSVRDEYIVCLENGLKFKSLKRHLMTSYGMTPAQYREKWGLPKDYPMVAPGYAKARSDLAKAAGLGKPPVNAEGKVASVAPADRAARRTPEAAAA